MRTGYIPNSHLDELNAELQTLLGDLDAVATNKNADEMPPLSLGRRLLESLPGRTLIRVKPRSLAFAEVLAREGGRPLSADEAEVVAALETSIARGDRADLEKFAADLKDAADWYELTVGWRGRPLAPIWIGGRISVVACGAAPGRADAASVPALGPDVRPRIEEADTLWISAQWRMLYSPALDRDAVLSQLGSRPGRLPGQSLADLASFRRRTPPGERRASSPA